MRTPTISEGGACAMAVTPINSEDRLVQATFAEHLEQALGWESIYAWNDETFGPGGRRVGGHGGPRISRAHPLHPSRDVSHHGLHDWIGRMVPIR